MTLPSSRPHLPAKNQNTTKRLSLFRTQPPCPGASIPKKTDAHTKPKQKRPSLFRTQPPCSGAQKGQPHPHKHKPKRHAARATFTCTSPSPSRPSHNPRTRQKDQRLSCPTTAIKLRTPTRKHKPQHTSENTHTHVHTHTRTHPHSHTHTHINPHTDTYTIYQTTPQIPPISASLRGSPCSGVYTNICGPCSGLCSLFRRLMIPIPSFWYFSNMMQKRPRTTGVGGRGGSP